MTVTESSQMIDIPLDDIYADDEFNCRGWIPPASVVDLANDIEINGLVQPITVQPWTMADRPEIKWRIVCGHRRYMATKFLKRSTVKAMIREGLDEVTALTMNVSENLKRQDLNMLEEARVVDRFRSFGWDVDRISRALGQRRDWVEVRFDLMRLAPEIQERAATGFLTQYQVRDIAAKTTAEEQLSLTRLCVDHKIAGKKLAKKVKSAEERKEEKKKRLAMTGTVRHTEEIFDLQDQIQEQFGNLSHPLARCMAWCAGVISTDEFYFDIEQQAIREGKEFKRPE